MPSGSEAFARKKQQKDSQRDQIDNEVRPDYFAIGGGQYAVVRFLEQGEELTFAEVHRIPGATKTGKRFFRDEICLNTDEDGSPCPACQSPVSDVAKRTTRGFFNLIWREGPVYERDDNGRPKRNNGQLVVVARADGVFLWKCSWTVFELLREKDVKYKGLMSRDWEVKREGSAMDDTKYFIEQAVPDGGPQPMVISDLSLAARKYDLAALTRPKPYDLLAASINGVSETGPQPTMDRSAVLPTAQNTLGDAPHVRASAFQRA